MIKFILPFLIVQTTNNLSNLFQGQTLGRILSGRSKNNSNGSISYILSLLLHYSLLLHFPELYTSNLTVLISLMFCTGAVETMKLCIDPSLLVASLYIQVIGFLVMARLLLVVKL